MSERNGGSIIADVLAQHGVRHVFALCGGHISPILVGAKERGLRVVDLRDEASAVFAADAAARMTGLPGVAAVTAGPGVTNALTAIKNAQMAQSPIVVFGGATATILKGRGALQDIDQIALVQSAVKWATKVSTVAGLGPTVDKALRVAQSGVPGPVFVEIPVDVLYPESLVRKWYIEESGVEKSDSLASKALGLYLKGHLYRQFHLPHVPLDVTMPDVRLPFVGDAASAIEQAASLLANAQRPALVVGNQTMVGCRDAGSLAHAIDQLGIPAWLGGSARGLLGRHHPTQFRHARGKALKEADVVVVAGFPFDFRLKYGLGIGSRTKVVAANLSPEELRKNRRPQVGALMHPAEFLRRLAEVATAGAGRWQEWLTTLRGRESARDSEIAGSARADGEQVDPVHFFLRLEEKMADDAIIVADGGDFVATAAYTLRPRAPLSWLDPGVFGTLGVGGGFAVGAATIRPGTEVWILYGDGSCAYSLAEIDTCVRHGLAPIAVIGNDASWAQIARDQVKILGDDVGTVLRRSAYHVVAEGYGGAGLLLDDPRKTDEVLDRAKQIARGGTPVVVNVHLARSEFREGSISI